MLILPPVIGHRGAAGLAPENTLASFSLAADLGCTMVECDVRLSADGVPVVFHDDRLERRTNGSGLLAEQPVAALKRLDAGAGQAIPTLAEVVTLCRGRGMGLNLEIKSLPGGERRTTRRALEVAAALWPQGRPPPLVSSFAPRALAEARVVVPSWPRELLCSRLPPCWPRLLDALGCDAIGLDQRWLTLTGLRKIKASGRALLVYTVNHPYQAENLWFFGVSAVFSDRPDRLLAVSCSAVMNFSRLRWKSV